MRETWLRKFGVLSVVVLILSALLVPAASAAEVSGAGCPPVYHRIVRGENLTGIAARFGVTLRQVMQWNQIGNADRIYWGRLLTIYPSWCAAPAPRYYPAPRPAPVPWVAPQPRYEPAPAPWVAPQPRYEPAPAPVYIVPPCGQCSVPACGQCSVPVCRQCSVCSDQRAVITYPYQGQYVSGMVTITGNATVDNFSFYKLEYGAGSSPSNWSYFFGGQWPIWQGTLGVLNAGALSSGTYTIRVTVVDKTSNYPPPCQVTIVVR
jgi:LysM domain